MSNGMTNCDLTLVQVRLTRVRLPAELEFGTCQALVIHGCFLCNYFLLRMPLDRRRIYLWRTSGIRVCVGLYPVIVPRHLIVMLYLTLTGCI